MLNYPYNQVFVRIPIILKVANVQILLQHGGHLLEKCPDSLRRAVKISQSPILAPFSTSCCEYQTGKTCDR